MSGDDRHQARTVTIEVALLVLMFVVVSYGGVMPTGAVIVSEGGIGPEHVVIVTLLILLGVFFAIATRAAIGALQESRVEMSPFVLRSQGSLPPIRPPSPPKAPIAHRLEGALVKKGVLTKSLWGVIVRGVRGEMPSTVVPRVPAPSPSRALVVASSRSVSVVTPAAPPAVVKGNDSSIAKRSSWSWFSRSSNSSDSDKKSVDTTASDSKIKNISKAKKELNGRVPKAPAAPVVLSQKVSVQQQSDASKSSFFSSLFKRSSEDTKVNDDLDELNRRIKKHIDGLYR